ncbi:hypothetical protein [Streptomyces sp. NWU339]|uniref:hypothetical protein n=1 Tax=Streptomyces sp. NWU339 TaxID=2185284 RepID=UPI0015E8116A|nr:hypothetical protein [Streptomyces sp. NWU339]
MIKGWGAAASITFAVAAVAGLSGCGGDAEADAKKPAASATAQAATLDDAATTFQDAVTKHDTDGGCLEQEPGTCWEQMQALIEPARTLRKAMNAEKSVGADFWTEAYTLIDTMEEGVAVGDDQGAPAGAATDLSTTNRDDVFGSAHDLVDWLDAHPIK